MTTYPGSCHCGGEPMRLQAGDQGQLFYVSLERRIPTEHLLRRINPAVAQVMAGVREKLAPFYSEIGRPSVDPELLLAD
jgi:hypothetical protein